MAENKAQIILPAAMALAGGYLSNFLIGWVLLGIAAWLWRRRGQVSSSSSTA